MKEKREREALSTPKTEPLDREREALNTPKTEPLGVGKEAEAIEEDLQDFEVQVFRMVIPMPSKKAPVVLQTAIEMILRLRANGYPIHQVHTDRGREFRGPFQKWMRSRGILVTQTSGADPQANGRAERAVQSIKQHVRRVLACFRSFDVLVGIGCSLCQ